MDVKVYVVAARGLVRPHGHRGCTLKKVILSQRYEDFMSSVFCVSVVKVKDVLDQEL